MKGWNSEALLQSLKLDSSLASTVMLTGYVPDDLLTDLYSATVGFVYPSIYEGFGLPVLEAMACGATVITSNTSSLPEVAGDAAILVQPTDIDAITNAMRILALEPNRSTARRALSIQQASKFDWIKTARSTIDVYQHACSIYKRNRQ
jgi:glycosyltransferase involved in cell wall biosynthesis